MYEYSTWLYVNIKANLHHAFYMKLLYLWWMTEIQMALYDICLDLIELWPQQENEVTFVGHCAHHVLFFIYIYVAVIHQS